MTPESADILISVNYTHARDMLSGKKTVELRRRTMHIRRGTRVWVYSKLPRGHIELVATVDDIVEAAPKELWNRYHMQVGIDLNQFEEYFTGVSVGCALLLRNITPLRPTLNLAAIRLSSKRFHPPQFFKRLSQGPELRRLRLSASYSP